MVEMLVGAGIMLIGVMVGYGIGASPKSKED
jgi:hypothetical protein